jgi:hypothetical protein
VEEEWSNIKNIVKTAAFRNDLLQNTTKKIKELEYRNTNTGARKTNSLSKMDEL